MSAFVGRLLTRGPEIAAYIGAWEWIGILGVIGVFLVAGVVTSHITAPASWRLLAKVGKDPQTIMDDEIARIRRRAEA